MQDFQDIRIISLIYQVGSVYISEVICSTSCLKKVRRNGYDAEPRTGARDEFARKARETSAELVLSSTAVVLESPGRTSSLRYEIADLFLFLSYPVKVSLTLTWWLQCLNNL